jgi:GTP cyclohydrolase I
MQKKLTRAKDANMIAIRNAHLGCGPDETLASSAPAPCTDAQAHAQQVDLPRAERAVRELLAALGEDPQREGLLDTPRRVAKMYAEVLAGRSEDAATHLARTFEVGDSRLVLLKDIRFASVCEHHLLPFIGRAHVAYLPKGRVVGLSKLARVVEVYARRAQVQERMTREIAEALMTHVEADAVLVLVEAQHYCMKMRGTKQPSSTMVTMAAQGVWEHDHEARREVLSLIKGNGC